MNEERGYGLTVAWRLAGGQGRLGTSGVDDDMAVVEAPSKIKSEEGQSAGVQIPGQSF
jgi:hypothetical protein